MVRSDRLPGNGSGSGGSVDGGVGFATGASLTGVGADGVEDVLDDTGADDDVDSCGGAAGLSSLRWQLASRSAHTTACLIAAAS